MSDAYRDAQMGRRVVLNTGRAIPDVIVFPVHNIEGKLAMWMVYCLVCGLRGSHNTEEMADTEASFHRFIHGEGLA